MMTKDEALRGLTIGDCRTRREAVKTVKELLNREVEPSYNSIKTELKPCEDAISRTEVIKSIDEREDANGKVDAESVRTDIVLIPPINPQPCGDLISRKAILEEFENDQYHLEFCKEHHIERSISMEMVRIRLHDLPSVNPQSPGDLISRQSAIFLASDLKQDLPDDERIADMVMAHNEGILEYQTQLSLLPPVTPQPKTGHWILTSDDDYEYCTCSECGYQNGENWMIGSHIKFCQECGAKMVEPQESEG